MKRIFFSEEVNFLTLSIKYQGRTCGTSFI